MLGRNIQYITGKSNYCSGKTVEGTKVKFIFMQLITLQVSNYGSGERVGRCLPVGSFLCMAGGRDRSTYENGSIMGVIHLFTSL